MAIGRELDLLAKYPKGKRDPAARAREKTPEDVAIARQFGREFFDGKRRHGYGGYSPDADRWRGVVGDLIEEYGAIKSFLDLGCGKGGLIRAMGDRLIDCFAVGYDISAYAIWAARRYHHFPENQAMQGDIQNLPLPRIKDKAFDLVVSINTIHNLDRAGCIKALQEIERVGRRAYVTVDGYRTAEERQRMLDWNLTALTILSDVEWKDLFLEAGYTGDWGLWIP